MDEITIDIEMKLDHIDNIVLLILFISIICGINIAHAQDVFFDLSREKKLKLKLKKGITFEVAREYLTNPKKHHVDLTRLDEQIKISCRKATIKKLLNEMKTEKELNRIGKFMSLILRHKPEEANITLDKEGWTDVKTLLKALNISSQELDWIVENNNKKRFGYNDSKTKIRANQGHSISEVEVDFDEVIDAPEFLYHGTSTDTFSILLKDGIKKMSRNTVHLSKDEETAINVGKRKSSNIVIVKVKAKEYVSDGNKLYISKNGVYLADYIPAKYVDVTPTYLT